MVDDNINDDENEKSLVVSDQDNKSRNKTKFVSELPLETPTDSPVVSHTEFPRYKLLKPLKGGCSQSDEEQEVEIPLDIDWEDAIISQLLELLTQNLSTIFQTAFKRISMCGYNNETAERVILRSGLYQGSKDVVSNIVDGALALLSKEKVFDNGRHLVFEDLCSLVDCTLLEMLCVLKEVKLALPVAEAMWYLLILDLNLVHACTMEGDSSSGLKLSQSKTENTPIAQTLQSKVPVDSGAPQEPESKNSYVRQMAKAKGKGSSTSLPKAEAKTKATVLEEKSGAGQKALNSKKDLHRRKTYQFEKNCRSSRVKNIKANITAWGNFVLEKKLNSSDSSGATKKSSHSKVKTSVKCNQCPTYAKASSDSPCPSSSSGTSSVPRMQDKVNGRDPNSLSMEPKYPDNTTISSAVPDYYAGIPYYESLGKYVPQNERDEAILLLTSRLKTQQKELQGWSDWENVKVMQATWRLGKDQAELKMLRQDAEKVHQEMQMLEKNNMEKIVEIEQELVNTNSKIETANSRLNALERDNVELKREMLALTLSTDEYAMNVNDSLAKEQEAVNKCQATDLEKRSFEEDLSTIKQEKAALQQQQEKAIKRLDQFEVLLKQEEWEKQRFLQQADSLKTGREQLRVRGKVQQDNFREKLEKNSQKFKAEMKKRESEISQLRFQIERSKIEALKRGIPQMTKGLAAYAESSDSIEWECVMCMNEQISVVFFLVHIKSFVKIATCFTKRKEWTNVLLVGHQLRSRLVSAFLVLNS